MVADTKSSMNLFWMAIRVEKIIHLVNASERTGMIWLLDKNQHDLGVGVEVPHVKFKVLADPLIIQERSGYSCGLTLLKCNLMPNNPKVRDYSVIFCLNGHGAIIIIEPIVNPIVNDIVMHGFIVDASVVDHGIAHHDGCKEAFELHYEGCC
jgi:hypothetical protein